MDRILSNPERGDKEWLKTGINQMAFKPGHITWNKGIPCSRETRVKISESVKKAMAMLTAECLANIAKGNKGKNKGRIHTEETKRKFRESHLGKKLTEEHKGAIKLRMNEPDMKVKISMVHLGRRHSPEEIANRSAGIKKAYESIGLRRKLSDMRRGEKSCKWKGGITSQNKLLRGGLEIDIWRKKVFERDGYVCQQCFTKGNRLHAHHIQRFSEHPDLRFDVSNGITLCEKCHKEIHKKIVFKEAA